MEYGLPVQALFQKCFMKCCGDIILLGNLQVLPHPQLLERDYSVYCDRQLVPKEPLPVPLAKLELEL